MHLAADAEPAACQGLGCKDPKVKGIFVDFLTLERSKLLVVPNTVSGASRKEKPRADARSPTVQIPIQVGNAMHFCNLLASTVVQASLSTPHSPFYDRLVQWSCPAP